MDAAVKALEDEGGGGKSAMQRKVGGCWCLRGSAASGVLFQQKLRGEVGAYSV
jgi:hypothetical protein